MKATVLHILDDEELDFTYAGTTKFEGMEEAGDLLCDPKSLCEGYQQAMTDFREEVRRECARQVIDFQTIRTSESVDATRCGTISIIDWHYGQPACNKIPGEPGAVRPG